MAYDYIQENYEDVSSIDENLLLFDVTKESLDAGIEAARKSLTDIGVSEATGIIRIDTFRNTVGCRPGLGEWSAGAIATWYKESGLSIPDKDSSSATGWYVWAKKTGKWFQTPVIGSVAVYGTQDYDYYNDAIIYNAHHLGLVIQVDDEENTVVTCENVNGVIAQAFADVESLLGFIIPSKADIEKPKLTYEETADPSKENNIDESTEYTVSVQPTNKDYIREVVSKVLSTGETNGYCSRGTYNLAHQFIRKLLGRTIESGTRYAAGGHANSTGYHKELERLGYNQTDYGIISHKELQKFLNNSNNWNIGDIAVYWAASGVPESENCFKYGHTQIFTGGYQEKSTSKWATDNVNNYGCAFVYASSFPNARWRFIRFNVPTQVSAVDTTFKTETLKPSMLQALKGHVPDWVIAQIPNAANKFGITTNLRLAHFLAQCAHESGNFRNATENLNYTSASRLRQIFKKYFTTTPAEPYVGNPQKIANRVYSSRLGNGSEASGDGWKFRGRGHIQLTGKSNYAQFDSFIEDNILSNPDLVATKYPLASAAFFFYNSRGLWALCDKGANDSIVTAVTKRINGGYNGLDDRLRYFRKFYKLLK
jgi:putative chitinase